MLAANAGCGKGLSDLQTHPDPKASDFAVSVDEDTAIEISTQEVLAHVTDDKNLTLEVVALRGGSLGVLSKSGQGYTYTTNENANGVDVLSYEVKDSANVTAVGEIRVTINPKPDVPLALKLSVQTSEDVSLDIKKSDIKDRTSDPDPGDFGTIVFLHSVNAAIPVII
ncbi:MAG: cadherin-like domain-containing protein, partial [Gammaproteobacteria bacterium]|nr:cadherin-like domain-containing protein [Gammaproteobacteria bacterium]